MTRGGQKAGIIGWGIYVPPSRVDAVDLDCHRRFGSITEAHLAAASRRCGALGVSQFAVPSLGEDSTTMGIEASIRAMEATGRAPAEIQAVYLGSESRGEFKVRPTSTIIASYLGAPRTIWAKDIDGACAGGAMALEDCLEKATLGKIQLGLAVGADVAFYPDDDPAELTQGAAAVALLVGTGSGVVAVPLGSHCSAFHSDDFFRRNGQIVPHLNSVASKRAYLGLCTEVIRGLLRKLKLRLSEFDSLVFHAPYEKLVWTLSTHSLGLKQKDFDRKVAPHLLAHSTGNTYAASSLCGLAHALDQGRKGERILLCSFGSGAVALAIGFEMVRDAPKIKQERSVNAGVHDGCWPMSFKNYGAWRKHYWKLRRSGGTSAKWLCKVEPKGKRFRNLQVCSKCGLVQGITRERICSEDSCHGPVVDFRLAEYGTLKEMIPMQGSPRTGLLQGLFPLETHGQKQCRIGSVVKASPRILELVGAGGLVCYGPAYVPVND